MANSYKTDTKKKAMLAALEKSLGIVTLACSDVGISRETHYSWLREDDEYKKAVNSIDDVTIDFAESKLYQNIKSGDTTATIFFLKTKGKKRGYTERSEFELSGGINQYRPVIKLPDGQFIEI